MSQPELDSRTWKIIIAAYYEINIRHLHMTSHERAMVHNYWSD